MSDIDDGRVLYDALVNLDLEAQCDIGDEWAFLDDDRKEFYAEALLSLKLVFDSKLIGYIND